MKKVRLSEELHGYVKAQTIATLLRYLQVYDEPTMITDDNDKQIAVIVPPEIYADMVRQINQQHAAFRR